MDSFSGSDEEKEIWEAKKHTDSKNVIEEEEDLVGPITIAFDVLDTPDPT